MVSQETRIRRVASYVRVSTDGQTTENQTQAIRAACQQRGWQIVAVFSDNGISGTKDRDHRPGFDALWHAVTAGQVDVVAVWALDRLARSVKQLVDFSEDLERHRADLFILQQQIDTTTPAGRMFFQITAAFAEYECGMIRDRVKAGLERAKANGVKLGRPQSEKSDEVRRLIGLGHGFRRIRDATGAGYSMIARIREEMRV